jgi:hypothetical protein
MVLKSGLTQNPQARMTKMVGSRILRNIVNVSLVTVEYRKQESVWGT